MGSKQKQLLTNHKKCFRCEVTKLMSIESEAWKHVLQCRQQNRYVLSLFKKKSVCDLPHSERPFAGTTGTGGTTKRRECGWHERLAWSPCTKRTRRSEAPTTSLTPTTGGKWPRNFTWSTTSWKIGQRCLRHFITTPTCQQQRLTSIGLRLGSFLVSPFLFLSFIEVLG